MIFFSDSTSLYLDGYPRSGNTFASFLTKKIWPDLCVVHHFHSIAAIKISLGRNIPTFILIRKPDQAISSWYLKHFSFTSKQTLPSSIDFRLLERFLIQYVMYYEFVLTVRNQLQIIQFDQFVSNPAEIMKTINYQLQKNEQKDNIEITSIVNQNAHKTFGAKDQLGSSTPSAYKENLKHSLIHALIQSPNIERANRIYALLNHDE